MWPIGPLSERRQKTFDQLRFFDSRWRIDQDGRSLRNMPKLETGELSPGMKGPRSIMSANGIP